MSFPCLPNFTNTTNVSEEQEVNSAPLRHLFKRKLYLRQRKRTGRQGKGRGGKRGKGGQGIIQCKGTEKRCAVHHIFTAEGCNLALYKEGKGKSSFGVEWKKGDGCSAID